jgi:hypothetical protein
MEVTVLGEAGYEWALRGIGKSFGVDDFERLKGVAERLCNKDGGHNKFLESMVVWLELRMPRYLWAEFDTYRVGTTKQSESTIHTIAKKELTQEDFEDDILEDAIDFVNDLIDNYSKHKEVGEKEVANRFFRAIKNHLPEGYLQTRVVCTNYKVLRNIFVQRKNHVLTEWQYFIKEVLAGVEHPEFLSSVL